MKRLRIVLLSVLIATMLVGSTPVYAAMADPDTDPTLETTNVYRNLLETGDALYVFYANIPYATIPDASVTSAFIWQLFAMDGVTELGSTIGYAYNDNGYGYNIYSMYFSAAEFTANGMVWGSAYPLRLSGNPAVFADPPIYNYNVNAGDYSALTVTADVQDELALRIITIATDLDNKWGLLIAYSLIEETDAGTVLSIYGESFFRGAVYGVQALAPAAFATRLRTIDIESREWTDNYSANLTNQYSGTWVETGQEAGKALFGTDWDLLSLIILLAMCAGIVFGNIMITGDHWNGLIDASFIVIAGAKLGLLEFIYLILLAALCWIYISSRIWFRLFR